jgi:hypothetical protein
MVPADERFNARHVAGGEVDDGLVLERELVLPDRALEIGLELQSGDGGGVHGRLEHLIAAIAPLLRHVHR